MKLSLFKTLERKFSVQSFERDNLYIAKTLYLSSFFGNILSIILMFFFINGLVTTSAVHFPGQTYILPAFIIIFLTMFELLKRFMFASSIETIMKAKEVTNKFIVSLLFSLTLASGSFYLALNGAKEYVNTSTEIVKETETLTKINTDSINSLFDIKIIKKQELIDHTTEATQSRKHKNFTSEEIKNIKEWELDIKTLEKEREDKIKGINDQFKATSQVKLNKTNDSQVAFILLSTFIELLILIGVCFYSYYLFKSYEEQKHNNETSPNYYKLQTYKTLLETLYNNGKTIQNAYFPTQNQFKELVNAKAKVSQKEIKEFVTLMTYLKIIQSSGKRKVAGMSYEKAKEILNNYIPLNE